MIYSVFNHRKGLICLHPEEGMQETANKLIHIGKPIEFDEKEFFLKLEELKEESKEEKADIKAWVKELVPTYRYRSETQEQD